MIDTFLRYKDPAVQELTDTTFEHLTQVQPGGLPAYLLGLTTVYREITYSIIIKYAVLTLCSSWSVNQKRISLHQCSKHYNRVGTKRVQVIPYFMLPSSHVSVIIIITPVHFYQWLYWRNKSQPRFDPMSGLDQL